MNLLEVGALWLISWIIIIVLHNIGLYWGKTGKFGSDPDNFLFAYNNIPKNASGMFWEGLIYFIGNIICYYIKIPILIYIMLFLGVALKVSDVKNSFSLILNLTYYKQWDRYYFITVLSSIINTYVPLVMAVNIYLRYIQS